MYDCDSLQLELIGHDSDLKFLCAGLSGLASGWESWGVRIRQFFFLVTGTLTEAQKGSHDLLLICSHYRSRLPELSTGTWYILFSRQKFMVLHVILINGMSPRPNSSEGSSGYCKSGHHITETMLSNKPDTSFSSRRMPTYRRLLSDNEL